MYEHEVFRMLNADCVLKIGNQEHHQCIMYMSNGATLKQLMLVCPYVLHMLKNVLSL